MGRYRSPRSPASDEWEAGSSAEWGGSGEERMRKFCLEWTDRRHTLQRNTACEPLET